MNSRRERLIGCFTAVFPELSGDEAPHASVDTIPAWDSSRHFMLMQVIEEAFEIQIPEDVVGEVDSFAAFEGYLAGVSRK
jgi:acyl carrier protein